MNTSSPSPPSSTDLVLSRLSTLQEELEKNIPSYKDSLRTIHNILRQDEDLVHVLSEEQIGVIIAALSKHKGVVIATSSIKGVGKNAKKPIVAEDL